MPTKKQLTTVGDESLFNIAPPPVATSKNTAVLPANVQLLMVGLPESLIIPAPPPEQLARPSPEVMMKPSITAVPFVPLPVTT